MRLSLIILLGVASCIGQEMRSERTVERFIFPHHPRINVADLSFHSAVVVIARVTAVHAELGRENVYTIYDFGDAHIVKPGKQLDISPKSHLSVVVPGGDLHSNGLHYITSSSGEPELHQNSLYVLFLEPNRNLDTSRFAVMAGAGSAFEIRNGKMHPLRQGDDLAQFEGQDVAKFTAYVQSLYYEKVGTPLSKQDVLALVRGTLPTEKIANIIKSKGVDFHLTAETEVELRSGGARPEVLAAVAGGTR